MRLLSLIFRNVFALGVVHVIVSHAATLSGIVDHYLVYHVQHSAEESELVD